MTIKQDEISNLICERLTKDFEKIKQQWDTPHSETPTRFVSIDDLLPDEITQEIHQEFSKATGHWKQMNSFRERKKTLANIGSISPLLNEITYAIQAENVVALVSQITGITNMSPDPLLYAGGISTMGEGDFLNPHIDNSHNVNRSMYRKLNLLYYVTPDWQKSYGGNLELWNPTVAAPVEIWSKYNRLVLMETNKESWHSVTAVTVKKNRCCVSNYYFAQGPQPYNEDYYHVTSFMGRPGEYSKRIYSRIDNFARQLVAQRLRLSRGKDLLNETLKKN